MISMPGENAQSLQEYMADDWQQQKVYESALRKLR